MPASLRRNRATGGTVLLHRCEACGRDAPFGYGVHYRLALVALARGDHAAAKRLLGRWYCRDHAPAPGGDVS